MKFLVFTLLVLFTRSSLNAQTNVWQPSPGHAQIPIWPSIPPDAQPVLKPEIAKAVTKPLVAGKPWILVDNVSQPTRTVYSPTGKNTGVAMVVFPGGGYNELAIDLEGTEICDWLNSKGITAVLLKYRVPGSGPHWDSQLKHHVEPKAPMALEDAQRTVGLVRFHAAELHIDSHKIGVIGFSAGGHLVANISTHFDKRSYPVVDAADKESCRPDFGIAIYPGHMTENTTNEFELNPTIPITSDTPPQFIVQAENDNVDGVNQALVYYMALKNAGVPVEMHLYAQGGHAFGLRRTKFPITAWPQLAEEWLGTIGMTSE
jgi:acetyl esterase/lipase